MMKLDLIAIKKKNYKAQGFHIKSWRITTLASFDVFTSPIFPSKYYRDVSRYILNLIRLRLSLYH